jgi:hypothetical protein
MLAKWFNSQQAILVLTNLHLMPLMLQKVPKSSPSSNKRIPQICQFSTNVYTPNIFVRRRHAASFPM